MEKREELIGVVWAVVLVQGAITLLSFLEALVIGAFLGVALVPVLLLTGAGAAMALAAARGLRHGRRWARRVTLIAESLILAVGTVNAVASIVLTQQLNLMPFLTTIAAPVAVILMLRRTKSLVAEPVVAEPVVAEPLVGEPIAEGGA